MSEVRDEKESLKTHRSLQLRYFDIIKQDDHLIKNLNTRQQQQQQNSSPKNNSSDDQESDHLVSLSLGRSTRGDDHEAKQTTVDQIINNNSIDHRQDRFKADDLTLGLANDGDSFETSLEDQMVKESAEVVPKKSMNRNDNNNNGDHDDTSHDQSQAAKRARVSVRARCETPTMNDGCQWRKYGQKIAKGNPCPRAYYRCTVAPSCPVRKQVQRCAEDMSILITTYEGNHNHSLPVTATAMASTTSAAASMLLSGSSSTSSLIPQNAPTTNASTSGFGQHDFFDTKNTMMRPKQQLHYFPSNNPSSFSPNNLFPTITLDLTSSPSISQSSISSPNHFMIGRSSSLPSSFPTTISTPSLSFSNNTSETSNNVHNLPSLWANNGSSYLGYNNNKASHHQNSIGSLNSLGRQSQEFLYQRCAEKLMSAVNSNDNIPGQGSLTETLTKAITADPGAFKSVIAAAISSMVGGGGSDQSQAHHQGKQDSQRLTLGLETLSHTIPLPQHGKGLASSSFFNGLSSSNF